MIPGTSAIAVHRTVAAAGGSSGRRVSDREISKTPSRPSQARTLAHLLLPRPIADPFTLYQLVVADLIVLMMACGVLLLLSPSGGLPQPCMPIYAVLVTLFGFSEGLYRSEEPRLVRIVPMLARSALFAIALVFVAARGEVLPLPALTALTTSLAAVLLWRYLR